MLGNVTWESDAMDLETDLVGKVQSMMEAEYEKLCAERQTRVIDKLMVSTAFHRIINAPAMRIAKLESQLAAEASAVEELKQAYETAREMPCDANPFSGGRKSGYVRGLLDALDIVTNHRVAALVQAEGTQPNSTESEVRE